MRAWRLLLIPTLVLTVGCTEEGTENPPDAGPELGVDGQTLTDGADDGSKQSCEPKCVAEAPYLCVTDPASSSCVECLEDADCTKNPAALGPKCNDTGMICVCDSDQDCTGNPNGATCNPDLRLCGCADDSDCAAPKKCVGKAFAGAAVCALPCKSDGDCTSSDYPECDTASGSCVQCMTSGDCPGAAPICGANGECLECQAVSDCEASPNGSVCAEGKCTCSVDGDCTGSYPWGAKCDSYYDRCACAADADCAGNANGPTCYTVYKKCSCAADGECTKAPYTKCALPYSSASYMHCRKPCAQNTDCTDKTLPTCNTSTGKCVACKSAADCAATPATPHCLPSQGICAQCTDPSHCTDAAKPYCNTTTGQCVECQANSDCASQAYKKTCDDTKGWCVECTKTADCTTASLGSLCQNTICICNTDTDCASNLNGHKCDAAVKICSCLSNFDCPSGRACTGTVAGKQVCQ